MTVLKKTYIVNFQPLLIWIMKRRLQNTCKKSFRFSSRAILTVLYKSSRKFLSQSARAMISKSSCLLADLTVAIRSRPRIQVTTSRGLDPCLSSHPLVMMRTIHHLKRLWSVKSKTFSPMKDFSIALESVLVKLRLTCFRNLYRSWLLRHKRLS